MKNFLVLFLAFLFACNPSEHEELVDPEVIAKAGIFFLDQIDEFEFQVSDNAVGEVTFSQYADRVVIEINLVGMEPNSSKAIHIHNGSVEVPGRHWNAGKFVAACQDESLGKPWMRPFIGDVGNVMIDESGVGSFTLQTDLWRINSGDNNDILDKVIIVHDEPQDFVEECDPFHSHDYLHTNKKIAGGTIELASEVDRNIQMSVTSEQIIPDFLICK